MTNFLRVGVIKSYAFNYFTFLLEVHVFFSRVGLGTDFKTQSDILNVVVDVMKQYPTRRLTPRDYPVLLRWPCQQPRQL